MAGIYIHIPFCKQPCNYCNFHFSTSQKLLPATVEAIIKEASLRKDEVSETIETIYFGGGTPSLLPANELQKIIEHLHSIFAVADDIEITLEANPDDIDEEKLMAWKLVGINRLSIGIQSFFDKDLKWMNRAHDATQANDNLKLALQYFNNISIDLIYGTPLLTDEEWQQNISTAIELNIPHLSCYALTVEPKTALQHLIDKKEVADVDADKQARHFGMLVKSLQDAGYEHYEISNFAKPGWRSKHNSSYWQNKPYIGLGPSAHSFNGKSRQWNVANNSLYVSSIQQNSIPFEIEYLTPTQQLNEYIMTSLRTMEGIRLLHINDVWGTEKKDAIISASGKWDASGHTNSDDFFIRLTAKGKFMADGIAADLFRDETADSQMKG
jgi:oxygen-independent coproporphyrinogen-3 oxidase